MDGFFSAVAASPPTLGAGPTARCTGRNDKLFKWISAPSFFRPALNYERVQLGMCPFCCRGSGGYRVAGSSSTKRSTYKNELSPRYMHIQGVEHGSKRRRAVRVEERKRRAAEGRARTLTFCFSAAGRSGPPIRRKTCLPPFHLVFFGVPNNTQKRGSA